MDVNFVDPPIDGHLDAYDLQVTGRAVTEEFADLAAWPQSQEANQILTPEGQQEVSQLVNPDGCAALYSEALPFVARFLRVELDTQTPGNNGIGRLRDGDPPPRFGGKYRRRMKEGEARREVGRAIERLILAGFLLGGSNSIDPDTSVAPQSKLEIQDRWRLWVRMLFPTYIEVVSPDEPNQTVLLPLFSVFAPSIMPPFEAACDRHKIKAGMGRRATFTGYFFAVGWALAAVTSGVWDE